MSQNKSPVKVFGWRNLPFTQKRAIKYESWTAFACWKQIEQAFLDWFGKQDSVLAQTFHGPSVSQHKTPVKVFGWRNLPFRQKRAITFEVWTLFAHSKQIDYFFGLIWKAGCRIQFWPKLSIALQCHKIKVPLKFLVEEFTFQTKESNNIWNLDPFRPLQTNWLICFGLIWKAGFSFCPNFPWPFSATK